MQPRSKPYPCGFWNDPTRECRCSPLQIQRYVGRISGPLLDRIDIHIDVPAVKFRELTGETPPDAEDSASIRQRVIKAREQQCQRFAAEGIFSNAAMTPGIIQRELTPIQRPSSRPRNPFSSVARFLSACHRSSMIGY